MQVPLIRVKNVTVNITCKVLLYFTPTLQHIVKTKM